ncbi:xylosyltransferase oxt [Phlebotomus argentipes]|uniref:xylosyltransferase oxt n=1 Tax=Phlebotomus argentipes TaxID=94469 RepID=UPI002892B6CE|nr:xylosyltransferase oxt [Phlebotomus argentipes]
MAIVETLAGRWVRRYRVFFLLGLLIISLQVFLAYKSLKLPLLGSHTIDDDLHHHHISAAEKEAHVEQPKGKLASQNHVIVDDEDGHNSNSNRNPRESSLHDRKTAQKLHLEDLPFSPPCSIHAREAISAINRAKTQECKQHIANISCAIQSGQLYSSWLPSTCPRGHHLPNRALGCYRDEKKFRILSGYYTNFKGSNSPSHCIKMCLQSGFVYAGVQYSTECFCGNDEPPANAKLPDPSCNMKCPGDAKEACGGYFAVNIYETGIRKFAAQVAELIPKSGKPRVRIAFLLTLNGRALRQVHRLLKALYSPQNYFYIHVDSRQDYLFRNLVRLESKYPNIRLTRQRFSTIWGGASLLQMLLTSMRELLASSWSWDYVINLSESDFPVKSMEKLTDFLTANHGMNFVKSHGREVQRFIQKQGLDKTFVECDTHMWRVGDRELPHGVQIDGGSDWIALNREFVGYVTKEDVEDDLLTGLLTIFRHTLLPAESFFHTVLRNSQFCHTYIDNNLHVTNWKRRLGCKCQYKHVVDWCGCSPNDFKPDDWPRLQATEAKQLFFARKFEPIVNQAVILQLEEWLFGPYPADTPSLNRYWQSVYHYLDRSPPPDDVLLTVAASLARINAKTQSEETLQSGKIVEVMNFMEDDEFKGFIVQHEISWSADETESSLMEILVKPTQMVQTANRRFRRLEVSSDYDQKEQIGRNYPRALGPQSEPVLIFRLAASDNHTALVNLTAIWLDPTGNLADTSELHIEDASGASVNFVKGNLRKPLLPGVWTVKLILKKTTVAICRFLIVPMQFHDGEEVAVEDARRINRGTISESLHVSSEWISHVQSAAERAPLELKARENAEKTGRELAQWIDNLVSQFFILREMCSRHAIPQLSYVEKCEDTAWSSAAPDPKSDDNLQSNVKA